MSSLRIAVDIGGTFTDGVALDGNSGTIWVSKALTTPDDPGEAVSTVVSHLLEQVDCSVGGGEKSGTAVEEVVHGTTLVTNALIERKGAPTAAIVTRGTRDVLDIRRELRYDLYDLHFRLPEPLVASEHRFELEERIAADGAVLCAPDETMVDALLYRVDSSGVRTVAICFLHSYLNDAHERRIGELLQRKRPDLAISLSALVAREMREYERMSTVCANAYVKPLVSDYLHQLKQRLLALRVDAPLRVMLSSGGFTSSEAAAETPIALLESGPAGGVLGAINVATGAGITNIFAFDMGGTTAKACVVNKGEPSTTRVFEAARVHRFKRGSGLPLLITSIDLLEIGAGGGSLATISELGLLNVGPKSAGANPGPVCYGRGGKQPTVTDADLWLGYLDSENFLGGKMRLDREAAGRALGSLGEELGMPVDAVAFGIHDVVNENMAGAARIHIAEKGFDPREFTLVATGGAGPVHAVEIARKLGISRVLCGPAAGAGSCLGFLAAPVRVDRSLVRTAAVDRIDWDELSSALKAVKQDAIAELVTTDVDASSVTFDVEVEMRYRGQGNTVIVTTGLEQLEPSFAPELAAAFEARYQGLFGRRVPKGVAETVAWRLVAREPLRQRSFARVTDGSQRASDAPVGERSIYQPMVGGFVSAPVYDRHRLPAGARLRGPLVVEEGESTLVVPVPAHAIVRRDLSIVVEWET